MRTKLFHRLSYLLCLFQISCFVALQRTPLHSSSFSDCSNEHKKIDVACNIHSEELQIEPKNLGNELLVYGFIREFEPKVANKIIPDCIINLCVDFSRRMLPCDCIKGKYRKILPQLDMDEDRKKALIFVLMYKIEDVQDEKAVSGKTILHYACKKGGINLVRLLIYYNANIDIKNNYNELPFLFACGSGHLKIAKLLKERGTNINAKDVFGDNALHRACLFSGSVDMVTWLLDVCKIGIDVRGAFQETPFFCAIREGQVEIAKLLKERGANINVTNYRRYTALRFAKEHGYNKEMMQSLELEVFCTAPNNIKSRSICTPYQLKSAIF